MAATAWPRGKIVVLVDRGRGLEGAPRCPLCVPPGQGCGVAVCTQVCLSHVLRQEHRISLSQCVQSGVPRVHHHFEAT